MSGFGPVGATAVGELPRADRAQVRAPFPLLLESSVARREFLIEASPYDRVAAGTVDKRFSQFGFRSLPTDTIANKHWAPTIVSALNFSRAMFRPGAIGGAVAADRGEIRLANASGALNDLAALAWNGRLVTVLMGHPTGHEHGDRDKFGIVAVVTATEAIEDREELVIRLRARHDLDAPIQANVYAGTGGDEGGADLEGKRKPRVFGEVKSAPVIMVDRGASPKPRGQVNDGALSSIDVVRDQGKVLTKVASPPGAGQWSDEGSGFLSFGTDPLGPVSAEVKGHKFSGVYVDQPGALIRKLAGEAGIADPGGLVPDSFAQLDLDRGAAIGYATGGRERSYRQVIDELLVGVHGFSTDTRAGLYKVGAIKAPTGDAVATFDDRNIGTIQRLDVPPPFGRPIWRVRVGYARNFVVHSGGDLVTGATQADLDYLVEEWRFATAEDASVKTADTQAGELEVLSPYALEADGQALADELLALWKVARDFYRIAATDVRPIQRDLGDTVRVTTTLVEQISSGFVTVFAIGEDLTGDTVELDCFG